MAKAEGPDRAPGQGSESHEPSRAGTRWRHLTKQRQQEIQAAAGAGRRRATINKRIDDIVARAGDLSPAEFDRLRALLPDPGDDQQQAS